MKRLFGLVTETVTYNYSGVSTKRKRGILYDSNLRRGRIHSFSFPSSLVTFLFFEEKNVAAKIEN